MIWPCDPLHSVCSIHPPNASHRIPEPLAALTLVNIILLPSPWLFVHFTLVALAFGAVIWAAVHAPAGLLARALGSRVLVLMGVVSYSLYLWHYPLIGWMVSLRPQLPGAVTWALVVSLVVVAAASLSYRLVERPFLARS